MLGPGETTGRNNDGVPAFNECCLVGKMTLLKIITHPYVTHSDMCYEETEDVGGGRIAIRPA